LINVQGDGIIFFHINTQNNFDSFHFHIVTWHLKAGIVKSEKMFIARQRLGDHVFVATNNSEYIVV
jgi:hypothetical protein